MIVRSSDTPDPTLGANSLRKTCDFPELRHPHGPNHTKSTYTNEAVEKSSALIREQVQAGDAVERGLGSRGEGAVEGRAARETRHAVTWSRVHHPVHARHGPAPRTRPHTPRCLPPLTFSLKHHEPDGQVGALRAWANCWRHREVTVDNLTT